MSDAPDMDALLREQNVLQLMNDQLANIEDAEQHGQALEMIAAQVLVVEGLAKAYEEAFLEAFKEGVQQEEERSTEGRAPIIEIVLTPEQRVRVKEQTGVDMVSVKLEDSRGDLTEGMHEMPPEEVEPLAIKQAEIFNAMVAAHEERQAEIAKAREAIEATGDPELLEQFEALLAEM